MAAEEPKYDVAISFLSQDLTLAQALYDKLCAGLEVFFFPRKQEVLAGTDGLESMRAPFRHESRLSVVLYRPGWGNTPWTGVEEVAIKECCFENSYRSVFVYVLEKTDALPRWVPDTHVYFSAQYPLDEAVGAIKARVRDRGGEFKPLTPTRKAELNRIEEKFRHARARMSSEDGIAKVFSKVRELFEEIRTQCDEVNAREHDHIEYWAQIEEGTMQQICTIDGPRVSLLVVWYQHYGNSLNDAVLGVREFSERMIVRPGYFASFTANMIDETKYDPDISRALEYGWVPQRGKRNFLSSKELASQCVIQLLDLIKRRQGGKKVQLLISEPALTARWRGRRGGRRGQRRRR
jgi:hypothetical protein